MTPNPKPSLRERIRQSFPTAIIDWEAKMEAFAQEIEAEAYARGRVDGLEEAVEFCKSPYVSASTAWVAAGGIRALKERP